MPRVSECGSLNSLNFDILGYIKGLGKCWYEYYLIRHTIQEVAGISKNSQRVLQARRAPHLSPAATTSIELILHDGRVHI